MFDQVLIDNVFECEALTLNSISCLLISLFIIDENKFHYYINEKLDYNEMSEAQSMFLKNIINYLITKNKDILDNIDKKQCLKGLLKILKKYL